MELKKKILIVDDNLINRQILENILWNEYEVLEAENGQAALDTLLNGQHNIELILLDVMMPVMDGYTFLEKKKENPAISNIPVIITTQKNGEEEEVRALENGANDFVTKPYKPRLIKHRISNLINLQENAALINEVKRDRLTKLYTKEFFYQSAGQILKYSDDEAFDMICSNFENFKIINDMYGTKKGDELLCFFADVIKAAVHNRGVFGRLGADTFAVLLPHKKEYTSDFFQAMNDRINTFPINLLISIKYGIYKIKDKRMAVSSVCDRALLAARSIKGRYGTLFSYYDDSLRQKILLEQSILDSMEQALAEEQFLVYFQPKYNIKNDAVAGAEALVRWVHPQKGFMSPGDFIPIFEKNGFITKLDAYVWEKTCQIIRSHMDEGIVTVPISVNVSRADVYNPELAHILQKMIEKYGLEASQLHLEITESAYTQNSEQIISVVKTLKKMGFIIEMDDFGTGYSSLNMLSELPIDILKLDMKFIQSEMLTDPKAEKKSILSFVISLAKWMQLPVVAEGVETIEQVERLRSMECDFVQGYYYAKPMKEEDFRFLLEHAVIDT